MRQDDVIASLVDLGIVDLLLLIWTCTIRVARIYVPSNDMVLVGRRRIWKDGEWSDQPEVQSSAVAKEL